MHFRIASPLLIRRPRFSGVFPAEAGLPLMHYVHPKRTKPCGLKIQLLKGLCPFSLELPAPGNHGN